MKKVSVILPTYNRAYSPNNGMTLLEKSIISYFEQDYQNTELIILNDGSTDSTEEILNKYKDKCKILTVKESLKPPANQNYLWEHTTGDLVCQLHDDDQLTKDSISKRVKLFNENVDVVYGGAYLQNIYGDHQGTFSGQPVDKKRIITDEYINFTTLMWRKDIPFRFDEDLRYYFDWLFKIRCLNELMVSYTSEPVMYYTMHSGQESYIARATNANPEQDRIMRIKLKELGYDNR